MSMGHHSGRAFRYVVFAVVTLSVLGCAVAMFAGDDGLSAPTQSRSDTILSDTTGIASPSVATRPAVGEVAGRQNAAPDNTMPERDPVVESLLASLSLRQRIGQRFIVPVPGQRITYGAGHAINEVSPAGFIIYPWNFSTAEDVRRLTSSLQLLAGLVTPGISLLLCTDQEGGRVDTFRFDEFVRFPAAAEIGRLDNPDVIRSAAYITGTQLLSLGINMNLAPVLDVFESADNSIIGDRSYGGDPWLVARYVEPYLEGARSAGIIATAKHFPGHGVTTVDSHHALPVVATTREQLAERDLIPFATAIEAGVEVIMTGHILFENIDPFYPATLSSVFLNGILRGELGYDGVIITDGLEMRAIRDNYTLDETLTRLFKLDVDLILLFSDYNVIELVQRVERLVASGAISTDDIDRGVRRVLRLKAGHGLAEASR